MKSLQSAGRAGQCDRDTVAAELAQRLLEVVGGAHHLVRVCGGSARLDQCRASVAARRTRPPAARPPATSAGLLRAAGRRPPRRADPGARERPGLGPDHDLKGGAGHAAELALDHVARGHGLRARRLPAGTGERVLDLGGEGAEATTTSAQTTSTARVWVAVQAPSRPRGPSRGAVGGPGGVSRTVVSWLVMPSFRYRWGYRRSIRAGVSVGRIGVVPADVRDQARHGRRDATSGPARSGQAEERVQGSVEVEVPRLAARWAGE